MINKKRKTVGLVLGGGAARGYAHLGVLKVLEENNIPIDMILGTSMGAALGASYALNPNIREVTEQAKKFNLMYNLDLGLPLFGLIRGRKIEKFLKKVYQKKKFEDTKIPVYINAVDIEKEEEVIFCRGDLARAVRASISLPGIFVPVEINNRLFVDGGLLSNVQTDFLRKKVDFLITVNVFPDKKYSLIVSDEEVLDTKEKKKKTFLIKNVLESVEIYLAKDSKLHEAKKNSDIFIEPDMTGITMASFGRRDEIIKRGEEAGLNVIDEIKKKLNID